MLNVTKMPNVEARPKIIQKEIYGIKGYWLLITEENEVIIYPRFVDADALSITLDELEGVKVFVGDNESEAIGFVYGFAQGSGK